MGLWGKLTGRLSREEFVEEMVRRVRVLRGGEVSFDEEKFAVQHADGVLFLANPWAEYQRAPTRRDRDKLMDAFCASVAEAARETPRSFDEARPLLRPIVRERMFHAMLRLQARAGVLPGPMAPVAERSIGGHLTVTVAVDSPISMRELSLDDFASWKVGFDDALAEAKKNLGRISHARWPEVRPGVLGAPFEDYYDAARAALPHVIRNLAVRGEPVALVLQRGVLAVTGSDDERGLLSLAEIGAEMAELPRAMSAFLVRLDGESWVPHALPADHPARARLEMLRYQWTLRNNEEQKELLQKIVGEDLYVGRYLALEKPDGELTSVATLTLDVPALLPLCDEVSVVRVDDAGGGEAIARVPWQAAAETMDLREEPELYPPRFRTDGKISDEKLAALTS